MERVATIFIPGAGPARRHRGSRDVAMRSRRRPRHGLATGGRSARVAPGGTERCGDGALLLLLGHGALPCLQRHRRAGRRPGLRGLRWEREVHALQRRVDGAVDPVRWRPIESSVPELPESPSMAQSRSSYGVPKVMVTTFVAYPANPAGIPGLYAQAIKDARLRSTDAHLLPWTELRIEGRLIPSSVLSAIAASDLLAADISSENLNVVYEIGYAIGIGKPIRLLVDRTISNPDLRRTKYSIFETIGSTPYDDAFTLSGRLLQTDPIPQPLYKRTSINRSAPIYVIKSPESATRVTHLRDTQPASG